MISKTEAENQSLKIFLSYNRCGFDTYLEGYIEAKSREEAKKILNDRAKKFGKSENFIARVEQVEPINLETSPY